MKKFGLIGRSLKHSFSPAYFAEKFKNEGLADHSYQAFELQQVGELPALLEKEPGLCGLNVTIPYKQEVLPFLDLVSPLVERSGACNCIRIDQGKMEGFNTDITGFRTALELRRGPQHTSALVLGTGGAAAAVAIALKDAGITYQTVSRDFLKADLTYRDIDDEMIKKHLLIINTTPAGMFPHIDEAPDLPYEAVTPAHLFFDLIYNPAKTLFLKKAEVMGAAVENGYRMLVEQAEESWKIWNRSGS